MRRGWLLGLIGLALLVPGLAAQEVDDELEQLEAEQRELSSRQRAIEERRLELESQRETSESSVERDRAEQRFSLGSTLKVRQDEVSRDVLALGGGIKVDGEVFGNAVALGGTVKIEGKINGDVIAVGENVELGAASEVLGDVVSVGGEVERQEGAKVLGEVREVDFIGQLPSNFGDWSWWSRPVGVPRIGSMVREVAWAFFGSTLVLFLALLARIAAPRQLDRIQFAARHEFWMAAFVGLLIQLLALPLLLAVTILLLISIIGIPFLVLVPFMFLAFVAAALLGYAGVAQGVGQWLASRIGLRLRGGLFAIVVGVCAIQMVGIFADVLAATGLPFLITGMIALVGFVVKFAAWTVGLGGVVLGRMGSARTPPPSLPPLPKP